MSLPVSCSGCPLSTNTFCGKFTAVEGLGSLGVMIVAEASGEAEAWEGLPLRPQAPSGSIITKAISRLGYRRDQFHITNIVRCRPPRNWLEGAPYEREAIDQCRSNLDEAIERHRPRAILALGGIATRELTGLAGKKLSVSYIRGYVLSSRYGIPVIPTFHPAFIARGGSKHFGRLMADLSKAVGVAQGWEEGPVTDPHTLMTAHTRLEDLVKLYEQAQADPSLLIAYDIETFQGSEEIDEDVHLEFARDNEGDPESEETEDGLGEERLGEGESPGGNDGGLEQLGSLDLATAAIRTVQFALNDREGVSVPWQGGYIDVIKRVLRLDNPKVSHNGTWFDRPVLERHGCEIRGREDDTLIMYRALQPDLPAHLQAVGQAYGWRWPWKHYAGSDIEFYGVADVCVLHRIMARLPGELSRLGIWDTYERRIIGFRNWVTRPMEIKGLPVSRERITELGRKLEAEIEGMDREIEQLAPPELHKLDPYKNPPDAIKAFITERHPEHFAPHIKVLKDGTVKEYKTKGTIGNLYSQVCEAEDNSRMGETRRLALEANPDLRFRDGKFHWYQPFNPGSSKQLLEYLRLKRYPVPKRFKDGKDTTGDKEIERLQRLTKDPLLALARERRVRSKMVGSYTGKKQPDGTIKGGWMPGPDGRLRATILAQSTGQLSARNPNIMTLPVRREELAESFRRCIAAEPGHLILEVDMTAFHAKTTGLAARDASYMRLSGLDIHSYVAGWMIKDPRMKDALAWSDSDLKALLGEIKASHKRVRNFQAKPAILGLGFGMGYKRLYFENRDFFSGETEAKRLLDLIKSLFPKVFQWQDAVVAEADEKGYLTNAFGRRRWFWEATQWRKSKFGSWEKSNGPDAEKAKAFLPASNAHDMLKEKLLAMSEWGWLDKYQLVNLVHDATIFHCPTELVEEAAANIKNWLEAPVAQLADAEICPGGFSCGAEASVGQDWSKGAMKEIRV